MTIEDAIYRMAGRYNSHGWKMQDAKACVIWAKKRGYDVDDFEKNNMAEKIANEYEGGDCRAKETKSQARPGRKDGKNEMGED